MARDYGMDVMMVRLGAYPRSSEHAPQIVADPIARDVYFSPGDLAQFFRLLFPRHGRGSTVSMLPVDHWIRRGSHWERPKICWITSPWISGQMPWKPAGPRVGGGRR